ncbi:MAG TPA: RDD family protein [Micrococcaceae bacterium]|jgi:uncharacterized RDD family membrane protein YckC|nr:RDD family protein [Micrococcaceae bacterium]
MSSIVTGEAVVLELRPASFAARGLGVAIDMAVQAALAVVFLFVLGSVPGVLDSAATAVMVLLVLVFLFVVVPVGVETLSRGRSVGKLVMGLRVVRDDGGSIRFRHALIRGLVGFFELYLMLGSVAFIASLFNARSKRLGDMLAGTYSMRERIAAVPPLLVRLPESLQAWASLADIGRLPDALGRRVTTFLRQAPKMSPGSRLQMAGALADEAAVHIAPPPPPGTLPEAFLAAVVAERRDREYRRLVLQRERSDALALRLSMLPFPGKGATSGVRDGGQSRSD